MKTCDDCPNLPEDARKLACRRTNWSFRFQVARPDGTVLHDLVGTIGFDTPAGCDASAWRERELFITGPKEGTELLSLLQSGCVMVSHLLQQPYGPIDFDAVRHMLHGGCGDQDNALHVALAEAANVVRAIRGGTMPVHSAAGG